MRVLRALHPVPLHHLPLPLLPWLHHQPGDPSLWVTSVVPRLVLRHRLPQPQHHPPNWWPRAQAWSLRRLDGACWRSRNVGVSSRKWSGAWKSYVKCSYAQSIKPQSTVSLWHELRPRLSRVSFTFPKTLSGWRRGCDSNGIGPPSSSRPCWVSGRVCHGP